MKQRRGFVVPGLVWLASLSFSGSSAAAGLGVAVIDRVTTLRGLAVPVAVLVNDLDFAGPTTVTITGSPGNGGVVVTGSPGSAGAVLATYTPNPGFSGTDSFSYQAADGTSTGTATVQVTVLADADTDGVADLQDNCTTLANASQCDSDGDGYGNRCDGDLNNNGSVNAQDAVIMRQLIQDPSVPPTYNQGDINCNGTVNAQDTTLFRTLLGHSPGPSAKRGSGNSYTVTGTVSGLIGSGLVLRNNGGDNLPVSANGPFGFATGLSGGGTYNVTVQTPPTNPSQTCTVTGGSGTANSGNLPAVTVNCSINEFVVGGSVAGRIAGTPLVLKSRGDAVAMLGNGYFLFPTKVPSGGRYEVVVDGQPANPDQTCQVAAGASVGTIGSGDVSTLRVECAINGRWYYSANTAINSVSIYSVSSTGALTPIGFPVPTGTAPTDVVTDPTGRFAYVTHRGANPSTTAGTVTAYTINASTGALTAIGTVPTGRHPKSITLDRTASYAWVANFADNTVTSYRVNGDGSLTGTGTRVTGTAPEEVIVLTDADSGGAIANRYAYVPATGGKIWIHPVGASGALQAGSDATVTSGTTANAPQLRISTKPTFNPKAYVIDTDANAIRLYEVDRADGQLTLAGTFGTGLAPRDLQFGFYGTSDFDGTRIAYVVNAGEDTVSLFTVGTSGALYPLGSPVPTGPQPVSIAFDSRGTLAYVVNSGDGTVSTYAVDRATGVLSPLVPPAATPSTAGFSPTAAAGLATPYSGSPFALVLFGPDQSQSETTATLRPFSVDLATGTPTPAGATFDLGDAENLFVTNARIFTVGRVPSGTFAYAANIITREVIGARLDPLTGELSPTGTPSIALAGRPNNLALDPRGEFLYVPYTRTPGGPPPPCSVNFVAVLRVDRVTGGLSSVPGSPIALCTGAKYLAVDPSGTYAFVLSDSAIGGRIDSYIIDRATGLLVATGQTVLSGGEVAQTMTIDPSGRFLYATNVINPGAAQNPGQCQLGIFSIAGETGTLAPVAGSPVTNGYACNNVAVTPGGAFLYVNNFQQGLINGYLVDPATGGLTPLSSGPFATGSSVSAIAVTPDGRFLYSANGILGANAADTVSVFSIDSLNGALAPIPGTPFAFGSIPLGIALTP